MLKSQSSLVFYSCVEPVCSVFQYKASVVSAFDITSQQNRLTLTNTTNTRWIMILCSAYTHPVLGEN